MPARIALQMYSVREYAARNYAGAVRQIAAMGYRAVETSGFTGITPAEAGRLFCDLGLTVVSAHTPMPAGDDASQAVEMALAVGAPVVVSGLNAEDFSTLDRIKRASDRFNGVNAFVRARGLSFGVHNHSGEFVRVDGRFAYELMVERLEASVLLQPDVYWVKTGGADPAALLRQLGARAPLVHCKDGPCVKGEPMVALGDGTMDYHGVVAAGGDNTKWLIVEIDRSATDAMVVVERSLRYLEREGLGIR